MALIVGRQVLIMLIIMVIGWISAKTKLIHDEGRKDLAAVLLYVVNPFLVFLSFIREFSMDALRKFLLTFALSAMLMIILSLISWFLTRHKKKDWEIERYCFAFRNCGFFGIPIISSVYGAEGVFYLSAFLAAFNIWNWSYGVTIMKSGDKKIGAKEVLHNMMNPTIIATIIGFIVFIASYTPPSILTDSFQYISDMNTPLAMLVAGSLLAGSSLLDMLKDWRCLRTSLIAMALIPAIIIPLIRILPVDLMIRVVLSIAAACPIGTTTNLFALRFDKNVEYAARVYSVTTVMSVVTIPLFMLLY